MMQNTHQEYFEQDIVREDVLEEDISLNKMRRIITACVVVATALLMMLFGYWIYQRVKINTLDNRINTLETEIAQLEQVLSQAETDLEYYESEFYLSQKVLELQMLLEKK